MEYPLLQIIAYHRTGSGCLVQQEIIKTRQIPPRLYLDQASRASRGELDLDWFQCGNNKTVE